MEINAAMYCFGILVCHFLPLDDLGGGRLGGGLTGCGFGGIVLFAFVLPLVFTCGAGLELFVGLLSIKLKAAKLATHLFARK